MVAVSAAKGAHDPGWHPHPGTPAGCAAVRRPSQVAEGRCYHCRGTRESSGEGDGRRGKSFSCRSLCPTFPATHMRSWLSLQTRKSIFGTSGTKQSSGQPGRQSPAQDQRARAQAAAEERKRQAEEQRARAQAAAKERKRQAEEQRARAQAAAEERKRQAEEQRARAQAAAEERKRQAEEQRRKQQEAMLAAQKAAAERKAALARASGSAKVATGSAKVPAGSAKMQTFAGSAKVAARPGTARGTARGEAKSASGTATRAAFGLFGQPKAVSTASQSPVDDKKRQMEEVGMLRGNGGRLAPARCRSDPPTGGPRRRRSSLTRAARHQSRQKS